MTPRAETVLLSGIGIMVAGTVLAFVLSPLLVRRMPETAEFFGWLGGRIMVIGFAVAIFSTCGDIR